MRRLLFLLFVSLLLLPTHSLAQQLPPVDPASVTGDIRIAGTPILEPATNNVVTRFTLEGYQGNITIEPTGTAPAFQALCSGATDIVLADRQINPQEVDACTATGRPPLAFRIATSAVVIAVSNQNTFATSITSTELQLIFSSALSWSDVRPEWPPSPIGRFGLSTESSAFDLMTTVVFGGNRSPLVTAIGAQYLEDQNTIAQNVSASENAIGFFNADYALANQNSLTGVVLDGVQPNTDSIASNNYPLSRPLLIYTTSQAFDGQPQVASFLNYYLSNAQVETRAVGLFPPPQGSLDVAFNRWLSASGSTVPTPPPTATEPPTIDPLDPLDATATAVAGAIGQVPTVEPTAIPDAGPTPVFDESVQSLLVEARLDLELLAENVNNAERPIGWSGSLDIDNPQLPLLVRLDLELLGAIVYGIDSRPSDWFGAVSSTRDAISRDIRHDLEILADDVFGIMRPDEWAGADPIYRCDRTTQALTALLQRNDLYILTADPTSPDYCMQVSTEISRFVEVNLLASEARLGQDGTVTIPPDVTIETTIAVAFYNRNATRRAGLIPVGTGITPIARSYQGFSNMTLIESDGFLLFVEWQNTSLTQEEWRALPDEQSIEFETICTLDWCEGRN
ncbi:MAG: substrate-binding domain-containing protein [Anaerolineae bacterium]